MQCNKLVKLKHTGNISKGIFKHIQPEKKLLIEVELKKVAPVH
jgi:hypothetical protein